ncbi:P-loop containing nucleoside triphosphate hydrolase protein [Aspergillus avenaceus]|uniref:P-loop containing nucleoside triphosphate hydrolase protein n=1 Tax=Aspergillus avenaceus TaxID=36643 RepID=A0A5N6TW51_ASPAV|nr:P-loop containing nucleoside triphosphate hydrolase protein [Aspergillus avenaceus]
MSMSHLSLIYVIGAPGAGKGTLSSLLASDYGFHHISVGDLLRELSRSGSLNERTKRAIQQNELIEIDQLTHILESTIEDLKKAGKTKLLIDGIPRSIEQIIPLEDTIGPPDVVLLFDCPESIARQRFLARNIPGRNDDGVVFDKRYQEFVALNQGIVEHYERWGLLLKIDTSGDTDSSYAKLLEGLLVK